MESCVCATNRSARLPREKEARGVCLDPQSQIVASRLLLRLHGQLAFLTLASSKTRAPSSTLQRLKQLPHDKR